MNSKIKLLNRKEKQIDIIKIVYFNVFILVYTHTHVCMHRLPLEGACLNYWYHSFFWGRERKAWRGTYLSLSSHLYL